MERRAEGQLHTAFPKLVGDGAVRASEVLKRSGPSGQDDGGQDDGGQRHDLRSGQ